jgi:hypothetical protein
MTDEINPWFALRIQNVQTKEVVEQRVNIVGARHITVTWLLLILVYGCILYLTAVLVPQTIYG